MIVTQLKKECLLQWAGLLLEKDVHIHDFKNGNLFLLLLEKTHERTFDNQPSTNIEKFCRISEELSGFYQVEVDALINFVPILDDLDSCDFNLYALLLLVLTYGLQSKNSIDFKRCACQLTPELQQEIMHVTEELLQADHLEGRPINAQMLTCLSRDRGDEKICDISLSLQHRQLNFELLDTGTPNLYTSSPITGTPLRDWLDSPQMVQKSKLRVKEQELKQLRREVTEERHLRHDTEFEMEKMKVKMEALEKECKNLESKLSAQIQAADEQKDQLNELLAKEKVWEEREVEWKSLQDRLHLYKSRAKEARWWEKTCDEVIHERDSLRLKALALEERRNYVKDREQVESQMSDLISSLRDADKKIRSLIEERNQTEAISEALQRRNDDLERRLSYINFDDSFPPNAQGTEEHVSENGDFTSGESMRVVSDLRIAELESQLTAMSMKMVPREELLKTQAALDDLEKHRVPKELLELAKEVAEKLENEKTALLRELESLKSRFSAIKSECDRAVADLTISKEECYCLEMEAKKLNEKIEWYEATVEKLSRDLELTKNELERSVGVATDLEVQLNEKLILLNENEKAREELRTQIAALKSKTEELVKREEELVSVSDSQKLTIEEKQFEIGTLNARIKEIDSERERGIVEIERLSKKLAETCSMLHEVQLDMTSKMSSWQEREDALQNEIHNSKTELDSVSSQLRALIAEEESTCELAKECFRRHQNELENLNDFREMLTPMSIGIGPFRDVQLSNEMNLRSLFQEMKTALVSSVDMLKSAVHALKGYHDEKERYVQEYDATVSQLHAHIGTLQENISALTEERDRYQVETEALRSQLSNHVLTKISLNNLKIENQALTSKLQTVNERFARSKDEEDKLLQELAMLKADLMELETEYNQVSCEVDEAKAEAQRLQVDHAEKERQKEGELMAALKKLERVSSEKEKLSRHISALEEELGALEKKRVEIAKEREQLSLALEKSDSEIGALQARVAEDASLVESLKEKIEELQNGDAIFVQEIAEKEQQLSHARAQIAEKDAVIEEVTSQVLAKTQEMENVSEELCCKNEKVEMLQLELSELREEESRVRTEFLEVAGELQSLQTSVVEYRSVIDNKEELLMCLNGQLENKSRCLQELQSELKGVKEEGELAIARLQDLQSERDTLLQEVSDLQSQLRSVVSEKEVLSANWKAAEEKKEMDVSGLRDEMEKLLENQKAITAELQASESRLAEEVEARSKALQARESLEAEFNKLSLSNQRSVADLEKALSELQQERLECEDLRKELDSVVCVNAASQVESGELQTKLEAMRAAAATSEGAREEAVKKLNDTHQRLTEVTNEVRALSKEKEVAIRETNLLRSDLNRVLAENENHVSEIQSLHEENERLVNLQEEISRLESEVEILGAELQSSEVQKMKWAASEEEWSEKMARVEQENIAINHTNEVLQEKLAETEHRLQEINVRLEKELLAAANQLESRERAIAEERREMRKTAEEAREMIDAYREMVNAQLEDEREEETSRKETDSVDLTRLTLELENVRQNHQHLLEAQEEEMQTARREIEAFREEARQAEESLLSLQTDVKRQEKTISSLKEDRSKLRNDLLSMKNEYTNVLAESVALHRELEQREEAFNELAVEKEELEHTQQMNLTTINNLSDRCETIQQELRATKTERDAFESKMRHLEDRLVSEQEKTEAVSHQLEKSRDEVNEVLGRLSGFIREKEESAGIREHLEHRLEETISEYKEWKVFCDNLKAENNNLREALQSLEENEANLKSKCDAHESSKQEAANTIREVTDRYERLRSRTAELEADHKDEVRTYRARLEMAEKRSNALESEIGDLDSQLSEWRNRCQKLSSSAHEQEERLKGSADSRRVTEELLSEERQSRERYRVHCAELQTELLRLEELNAETQTRNRQLANKVRHLEVQLEFAAADAAGTSMIMQKPRTRSPPSGGAQPSPVFGNHRVELMRSYSEGGASTSLFENVNRETPLLRASRYELAQSLEDDNDLRPLRRRHSSPLTPSSRAFKSNQLARSKDAKRDEMLASDSSVKSTAPVTALSALFSCEDEPMDGVEWTRIQELQKRNMKQRSHLQSSYPVEMQMCKPDDITQALGPGSNSSLSHNYPNDSHRLPFSDLSNPYRSSRLAPNTYSEDLLRHGSETDLRRPPPGFDRHVSGVSVSKVDPSKEGKERSTFKVPNAPSGSLSKDMNVPSSSEPGDENCPPTSADVARQNISFEVINTPKKSHARGHFFPQKKQKYSVQTAVQSASGEVQRQQKSDGPSRDILGFAVKRFSSTDNSYPSIKRPSNKEKQRKFSDAPDQGASHSGLHAERHLPPVIGRRTLREHISTDPKARPQPGIIDKRGGISHSDGQNVTNRRLTKRKSR